MSAKNNSLELKAADEVCASCSIAGVDDVTLKTCDGGCDLVKYCSVECQGNHREEHNEECKKRVVEFREKELFEQPDGSYLGECPICCLPLLLDPKKSILNTCCCKLICKGCDYANKKCEIEAGRKPRCAFCREPMPKSKGEGPKRVMKRIKKHNDPVAMVQMGKKHDAEGDYRKAFEYWTMAAELGDAEAHGCLGTSYYNGDGVEKDEKKAMYHWEQGAIGGHPTARALLANYDMENGRFERAAKHFIISANLGCDISLQQIKELFVRGVVSKEDYCAALRGYQAAVEAAKSAEREKGEAFYKRHPF
jgi:hypothetical protein